MKRICFCSASPSRQSGIALITVLVLLVIVTLLAVSAGRNATQGELLARANRARQISLQAAESALRDARQMLAVGEADPTSVKSSLNFLQLKKSNFTKFDGTPKWKSEDTAWIKRGTGTTTPSGVVVPFYPAGSAGVFAQPEFIVERIDTETDPDRTPALEYFLITAIGYGPAAGTTAIVQETVVRETPINVVDF